MLSLYIYLHAYDKICMLLYGIYAKAVVDDSGRKQMAITHWGCSKTLFELWWIFKRHSDAKTRDCPKIKKKKVTRFPHIFILKKYLIWKDKLLENYGVEK